MFAPYSFKFKQKDQLTHHMADTTFETIMQQTYEQLDTILSTRPFVKIMKEHYEPEVVDLITAKYTTLDENKELVITTQQGKTDYIAQKYTPYVTQVTAAIDAHDQEKTEIKMKIATTPPMLLDMLRAKYPSSWEDNGYLYIGTPTMRQGWQIQQRRKGVHETINDLIVSGKKFDLFEALEQNAKRTPIDDEDN